MKCCENCEYYGGQETAYNREENMNYFAIECRRYPNPAAIDRNPKSHWCGEWKSTKNDSI